MWLREQLLSIIKGNPGPGDVHVDRPLGSDRRRRRRRPEDDEDEVEKRIEPRTLYVSRKLTNAAALVAWAKAQGFATTVPAADMHVTVIFSRAAVDWFAFGTDSGWDTGKDDLIVSAGGPRAVERFGEAAVLVFASSRLKWRHDQFVEGGASWDFADYHPHVTISWDAGDVDLAAVEPFNGELRFGPEIFDEVREDWKDTIMEKRDLDMLAKVGARHSRVDTAMLQDIHDYATKLGATCGGEEDKVEKKPARQPAPAFKIVKAVEEQRMVYGWASVISLKGKPYEDDQGDEIDADTLEKAATEFMIDQRIAMAMHERDGDGAIQPDMIKGMVVHSFPVTDELMKALGMECEQEGWVVGVKIADEETWKRVKSRELQAFSIGGRGYREAA